jgi:hypothetical protein
VSSPPLYRDTLALCGVLLEETGGVPRHPALYRRLEEGALRLLDHVVLAIAGLDRLERVRDADLELRTLRAHLHLAYELDLLDEEVFLALAGQADAVGRQVGGWLKKLRRRPVGGGP